MNTVQRFKQNLSGRQVKYGSNALVMTLAFMGILVLVNVLVYQYARSILPLDLTQDKVYSLTQETRDVLTKLTEPVTVTAFYSQQIPTDQVQKLLDQYQHFSAGNLQYRFIDPVQDPVAAQQAQITQDGVLVVALGDRQQVVNQAAEQQLTSALLRLTNPNQRVVYILTGHGERDFDNAGQDSFSLVKQNLENKGYQVKPLALLTSNEVPQDADVVIVAGPQQPLSKDEIDLLASYLAKGGAVVALEDPVLQTDIGEAPDPLVDYLAETWGINLGKDVVIDQNSNQSVFFPIGVSYTDHPITDNLAGMYSIFPQARSVTVKRASAAYTQQILVYTSAANAWGETDLEGIKTNAELKFDQAIDVSAPVPLGAIGENFQNKGRVVVFGDSDFATDPNFSYYANGDLLMNAIDWAAGEESLINLTPKQQTQRLMVAPKESTMNLIFISTVILVPGMALVAGGMAYLERRKRG
jgi:ABC-type uncharacterized transport system involved in gliding motility auxiliary subunit